MALRDQNGNFITPDGIGAIAYEYDSYSGSQISIMMGDVLIDSAVAISISVEQTKTPIFGYNSQYYSFLADGHVIVSGTLTIAFKEAGYLLWPMQRFQEKVGYTLANSNFESEEAPNNQGWTSPRYSVDSNGKKINWYKPTNNSLTEASKAAKNKLVMEANVEQMFSWQQSADNSRQNRNFNKFWRELGALPDNEFENWAETFEDAIWYGSDRANPLVRDKLFSKNISQDEQSISDEQVFRHRRADQYPDVDVWIVYGDMSHQPTNHTVKKILNLSFTGQSQVIEISGQPTYETYSFIARNIV